MGDEIRERLAAILSEFAARAYGAEEGVEPTDVASGIPDDLERAVDAILSLIEGSNDG